MKRTVPAGVDLSLGLVRESGSNLNSFRGQCWRRQGLPDCLKQRRVSLIQKQGVKSETAVGTPDFCLLYQRGSSEMTKEAAGAKKAESDGEIFLLIDFSGDWLR